jgi:protein arginine N-methyltransferase 1
MIATYSVSGYAGMIADKVRTDAFIQALRQAVTPGCVVVEIGTGTGFFALLAVRFGARRVIAIEPDDSIALARELAAANGVQDQIVFLQDISTRVTLPEQADVLLSDLRGVLPVFQHHIASIVDARKRFLAPGARMITQADTLWAAVVEAPALYARKVTAWEENSHGLDLRAARRILTNNWSKGRVTPEQLLGEPKCWASLDYATVVNPNVQGRLEWTLSRAGTAHGLSVWFDSILAEGVTLSNSPSSPELIYGAAFFPWSEPVALSEGDVVSATLNANLVGDDYIWRWDSTVLDQGDPGKVKANFQQSTFFGVPLSAAQLRKRAASHVPSLGEEGKLQQFILSRMDGETALEAIAHEVAAQYPTRFPTWRDALTKVGDLAVAFGR